MSSNHSEDYYIRVLCNETKIKEIMSTKLITIYEDDDVSVAEEKFISHGIYYLPVVSHDGQLKGLLSQKYLYKAQSPRKIVGNNMDYDPDKLVDGSSYYPKEALDSLILSNIMNHGVFTLSPEDPVKDAILNMINKKLGCIPIVEKDQKLCGILTQQNIIAFMAQALKE